MSATDRGTILVVDDSASKRYVLCNWLRRAGHTVLEAAAGAAALAVVHTEPIDVVVLDIRLPDMSGFDVCAQIKADPRTAAKPVIHVSAAAVDVVDRTQGLSGGADAYLTEPIDPDELLATIQAVLRYYRARQQLERLAGRLGKLANMAVQLNAATSLNQLLLAAVTATADIFDSPAMICTRPHDSSPACVVAPGPGRLPHVQAWTGTGSEVTDGSTVHAQPTTAWPQHDWPTGTTLLALGTRPRPDRPATYVVVPQSSTDEGAHVLTQIGQTVTSAIEGLRAYTQEHQLALTLQRSMLPTRLPQVPGYDFAVRYVPASDHAEVGGDFYELCQVRGRLAVAVGDIAGHSLHAATVMAEVRHSTRAYLAAGHAPAAVLDHLNQLILELIPHEIATLCLLDIEPETGHTRLANAGHPPPLAVTAGRATYLHQHSTLLGMPAPAPRESTFTIDPGTVLVLYTDGLIERRDRSLDDGLAALAQAATTVEDDLEAFCDRLLTEVGPARPDDDIAIVTLRRATREGR